MGLDERLKKNQMNSEKSTQRKVEIPEPTKETEICQTDENINRKSNIGLMDGVDDYAALNMNKYKSTPLNEEAKRASMGFDKFGDNYKNNETQPDYSPVDEPEKKISLSNFDINKNSNFTEEEKNSNKPSARLENVKEENKSLNQSLATSERGLINGHIKFCEQPGHKTVLPNH